MYQLHPVIEYIISHAFIKLQSKGYLLSKGGAQFLLSQLPIDRPIDLWLNTLRGKGLKGYASTKFLVWQEYSDIGWRAKDSDVFFSGHTF